jgi:hypothetical protein
VPAVVLDLVLARTAGWRPLVRAPLAGLAFCATFVAVQWPFASFLMTSLARNWVFGAEYMDFSTPPTSSYARYRFFAGDVTPFDNWRGLLIAAITASTMMWVGLHAGRAMQKARR